MKKRSLNLNGRTLFLNGLAAIGLVILGGCATTGDDADLGKIGPDYDDQMSQTIEMEDQMSSITNSLIP